MVFNLTTVCERFAGYYNCEAFKECKSVFQAVDCLAIVTQLPHDDCFKLFGEVAEVATVQDFNARLDELCSSM